MELHLSLYVRGTVWGKLSFSILSDSELKSMVCTNAECISISLSIKIGDCDTDQDK